MILFNMADISNSNKNTTDDFDESIDVIMSERKNQARRAGPPAGNINAQTSRPAQGLNSGAEQRPAGTRINRASAGGGRAAAKGAGGNSGANFVSPAAHRAAGVPGGMGVPGGAAPSRGASGAKRPAAEIPPAGHRINKPSGTSPNSQGAASSAFADNGGRHAAANPDNEATRITHIGKRVPPADGRETGGEAKKDKKAEKGKKGEKGEKDKKPAGEKDVGGSLVIGMVRALVYLVIVTVIAAVISVFIINVGNDVFAFVKSDEVIDVTIPENATSDDIADILYENGVIKYKSVFRIYGKLKDISDEYVAGEYSVTPMMNYDTLYYEFKEKPVSGTSWITIPEGYTADEIIDLMVSYGIGTKEKYIDVINNYDFDYWFVDELEASGWDQNRFYRLEGYLFPDTYEFYNASSEVTVINKLLARFDEVYTEAYKARAAELNMSTDQIIIIASMIEKEAGQSSDFRNVSSVFYNRLNSSANYPKMESDATVVYAIQHDTGERPKEVTGETIKYESPYNTYTNDGLPPGAICNPGMNALKYSLYPADTSYYYFVSSNDGVTLFATTNAEHENNKAQIKK